MSTRAFPQQKRLAFLSDVHGNLPALQAVLQELREADVETVYVCGDLLLGGQQPLEVLIDRFFALSILIAKDKKNGKKLTSKTLLEEG